MENEQAGKLYVGGGMVDQQAHRLSILSPSRILDWTCDLL